MAKKKPLNYFYINGLLHKKLRINRSQDEIITWCYPLGKRVTYTYSQVIRNKEPAFTTQQVCAMIGRGRTAVELALMNGEVEKPQYTYSLSDTEKKKYKHMWSEQDIMSLHDYLSTRHRGRPRNDGLVIPQAMPSKRELRALIRNEEIFYVKDGDEFKPIWRAQDFS